MNPSISGGSDLKNMRKLKIRSGSVKKVGKNKYHTPPQKDMYKHIVPTYLLFLL